MLLKVYSIYDSKVGCFMKPFFDHGRGAVDRSIKEAIADKSSMLSKYPADFTLFELGEYDDSTGLFKLHTAPTCLGVLVEYVETD